MTELLKQTLKQIINVKIKDVFDDKNMQIWEDSVTHISYDLNHNFEKLEFVGDKLLNHIFSEIMEDRGFKTQDELNALINNYMSSKKQYEYVRNVGLHKHLKIFDLNETKKAEKDMFESFFGALCFVVNEGLVFVYTKRVLEGFVKDEKNFRNVFNDRTAVTEIMMGIFGKKFKIYDENGIYHAKLYPEQLTLFREKGYIGGSDFETAGNVEKLFEKIKERLYELGINETFSKEMKAERLLKEARISDSEKSAFRNKLSDDGIENFIFKINKNEGKNFHTLIGIKKDGSKVYLAKITSKHESAKEALARAYIGNGDTQNEIIILNSDFQDFLRNFLSKYYEKIFVDSMLKCEDVWKNCFIHTSADINNQFEYYKFRGGHLVDYLMAKRLYNKGLSPEHSTAIKRNWTKNGQIRLVKKLGLDAQFKTSDNSDKTLSELFRAFIFGIYICGEKIKKNFGLGIVLRFYGKILKGEEIDYSPDQKTKVLEIFDKKGLGTISVSSEGFLSFNNKQKMFLRQHNIDPNKARTYEALNKELTRQKINPLIIAFQRAQTIIRKTVPSYADKIFESLKKKYDIFYIKINDGKEKVFAALIGIKNGKESYAYKIFDYPDNINYRLLEGYYKNIIF